jgi:hypothetical protein
MRFTLFIFGLLLLLVDSMGQPFEERTTTSANVRLNVTNSGTFGNALRGYRDGSANPSLEFPAGSGIEHLFESGVWFGGLIDGGEIAVSTSAVDAPQGYRPGSSGFEFTPASPIQLRSSLQNNVAYSPNAVSHQDFVYTFTDKNFLIPGTTIQINGHSRPLNIDVKTEVYNWNYSFSNFFVIFNFEIENNGTFTIDSAYFGIWANTVVRNINVTPAGSGGSAFYNKGANGFMDSLFMAYCYDHSGDVGFTQSYVGQKFLGAEDKTGFRHPLVDPRFKVKYNAWQFNSTSDPIFFQPTNDIARYQKLTEGLNDLSCFFPDPNCSNPISAQLNQAGNRSDLLSIGPFNNFGPGDKINVSYAFILAKKNEEGNPNSDNNLEQQKFFRENAQWAQTAYNGEDVNFNGILDPGEDLDGDGKITRFILPAPPDIPEVKLVAGDKEIEIYWTKNAELSIDPISQEMDFEGYKVYLGKFGFDMADIVDVQRDMVNIASFDIAGNGLFFDNGFDAIRLEQPVKFENDPKEYHYKYVVKNVLNGFQYAAAVTAFDQGNPEINLESLESSVLVNTCRVFAGKPVNENLKTNEPFVYPNPYYLGAAWEGRSAFQEQSRKLYFANLPKNCEISIYTLAGDFLKRLYHHQDSYGQDIRWFKTFASEDEDKNVFSGGEHAWDLLSENTQILARGLYIFTVKDLDTGELFKGKFAIIK